MNAHHNRQVLMRPQQAMLCSVWKDFQTKDVSLLLVETIISMGYSLDLNDRYYYFLHPSTTVFYLQIIRHSYVMCKGQCVYRSTSANVVPYFSALGYQCEPYDNPADFALDILIDASRTPNILIRLSDAYKQSTNHANVWALTDRGDETDGQETLEDVVEVEAAQTLRAEIFYVSAKNAAQCST